VKASETDVHGRQDAERKGEGHKMYLKINGERFNLKYNINE